jgi:hypothetical protein
MVARPHPDLSLTESQREILQNLPAAIPPARIELLWVFAPRVVKLRESGLLVISLLPAAGEAPDAPRTLLTLRYRAEAVKGKMVRDESIAEEGSAPPDRIDRVVSGVLARAGEQDGEPHLERIDGREERWDDFLARACIVLDRVYEE